MEEVGGRGRGWLVGDGWRMGGHLCQIHPAFHNQMSAIGGEQKRLLGYDSPITILSKMEKPGREPGGRDNQRPGRNTRRKEKLCLKYTVSRQRGPCPCGMLKLARLSCCRLDLDKRRSLYLCIAQEHYKSKADNKYHNINHIYIHIIITLIICVGI